MKVQENSGFLVAKALTKMYPQAVGVCHGIAFAVSHIAYADALTPVWARNKFDLNCNDGAVT